MRFRASLPSTLLICLALAGCTVHPSEEGATAAPTTSASRTSSPAPTTSAGSPAPAPTSSSPTTNAPPPVSCVERVADGLTARQRAGQLVMVALQAGNAPSSLAHVVQDGHVGNVLYLGGWSGSVQDIAASSAAMQDLATTRATGGIELLVAADQEGGNVQQLRGPGFSDIPTALVQTSLDTAELTREAAVWGGQLAAAGVNLNLAPVADVVPADLGVGNGPIGQWDREYGDDPETVAAGIVPFIHGMQQAGVATSVKHFPGIGRITGNPDFTTDGLVDDVMTVDDPYLDAFAAGIDAGASTVMVSSALYPRIDADHPAMFSSAVIDGLLRGRMGYRGVVISDDVNAAAVRGLSGVNPPVDLIAAGGDIVLTGDTASGAGMVRQITDQAASDPSFAADVDASLHRVLELKESLGLLPCG